MELTTWGLRPVPDGGSVLLSCGARAADRDVDETVLGASWAETRHVLRAALPPFALLTRLDGGVRVSTDELGLRHVYYGRNDRLSLASTSAGAAAARLGRGLDEHAVAVQSLLGWQLGDRTLFREVLKLPAGASAVVDGDGVRVERDADADADGSRHPSMSLAEAVPAAAHLLRTSLSRYLDDHPDAVLQLTGGLDSRILLSAVPPSRRRGLRTLTLGEPTEVDVQIASRPSREQGMSHEVISVRGLQDLSPHEAYESCVRAARRVECMADPLAFAAVSFAEAQIGQGPRLAGLGGEFARGFYHLGRAPRVPVSRAAAAGLASWRMFPNEAAEPGALDPDFRRWSRAVTVDDIFGHLRETGLDLFAATDEFYLAQRVQRWAGVTATAVCISRPVVTPMLDARFISIARALRPADKSSARFLGLLQVELDEELAAVPMDGRPAPVTYARPGVRGTVAGARTSATKLVRKARQRLTGSPRPPVGGAVLAAKVVEHWWAHPDALAPARRCGFVREEWLDRLVSRELEAAPSTVALLVNLVTALDDGLPAGPDHR
ncbi:asparagine synthetase B family protein [Ornithinimicrobium avium]|uniref:Asparagine synthetase domain-containing protein n=1 Tax=Ornithinimicrobium avium TaxID=2283195 RepID=A0A345NN00_9MICO|nr:hypothetical protein [Ornithinimicrobium avium]AXH96408.1 hypothetical protein DV701_10025 [Ornithinimicrobium avium]